MSARTREETAVEFAKAMGWTIADPDLVVLTLRWFSGPNMVPFTLPNMGDPMHKHLAFVGKVAEAVGTPIRLDSLTGEVWMCKPGDPKWVWIGSAHDLSHAAMLAAISAKRGAL